ncbi:hypothetical protein DZ937_032465, partial [Pseudomonas aeruginosa]|nr:hypothetical protein [Pseudomonas aeruginosa]NQA13973.1 hypothetical protein [Pseudomonas aeruginosa]
SAQQLTVERLTSAGGVDVDWPGFTALNSSTSRVTIDPTSLEGGWRGPFPACPVSEKTNFVEIDVFCPEGLCGVGREGQIYQIRTYYDIQWRDMAIGGAWTTV